MTHSQSSSSLQIWLDLGSILRIIPLQLVIEDPVPLINRRDIFICVEGTPPRKAIPLFNPFFHFTCHRFNSFFLSQGSLLACLVVTLRFCGNLFYPLFVGPVQTVRIEDFPPESTTTNPWFILISPPTSLLSQRPFSLICTFKQIGFLFGDALIGQRFLLKSFFGKIFLCTLLAVIIWIFVPILLLQNCLVVHFDSLIHFEKQVSLSLLKRGESWFWLARIISQPFY